MIRWIRKTLCSLHGKTLPAESARVEKGREVHDAEVPAKASEQPPIVAPPAKQKRQKAETGREATKDAFPKSKLGIRILTEKDDLDEIFSGQDPEETAVERKPKRKDRSRYPKPNTRKKIRVLTDEDDLYALFGGGREKEPESGEDFRELLEHSLSGEIFHAALREKERNAIGKKPGVREIIRTYPLPEAELDLHGCTSVDVAARVENRLKTLRRQGVRTLRIIVGKGLHSPGRAVLPDLVEKKLAELKRNGNVLTFHWEKRGKLKSGALIVYF